MNAVALPHLVADPNDLSLETFVVSSGGVEYDGPEYLPDWDYSQDVVIRTDVKVDLAGAIASAGLGFDAVLGLALTWHSTGSGLGGSTGTLAARDGLNTLVVSLPGSSLGGTVSVTVALLLIETGNGAEVLSANRPGSILWSSERRVRVEGIGSRFPMAGVSFESSGLVSGLRAAWVLFFESTELIDSALGSLRLYLNTDVPAVDVYLANPSEDPRLTDAIRNDVARQLVGQALASEELDLTVNYPIDSLGHLFVGTLQRIFPGESLASLRSHALSNPGEFDGYIQARGGYLQ